MQANTEKIKLPDTEKSRLPLGYKKIYTRRIPALSVKDKLLIYNKKYKFYGKVISWSNKPISKILKLK